MAFRKARYTAELEQVAEVEVEGEIRELVSRVAEVEGEIRELVSRDVVTNLGREPENESELAARNINSMLQRVTAASVQEIDKLITELESSRDMLNSEAARVQRELVQYSILTQAALQSTKIITESLTQWTKPALSD